MNELNNHRQIPFMLRYRSMNGSHSPFDTLVASGAAEGG
jgi:hypothetical protein